MAQNRHTVLPIVFGVLSENKNHWNSTVGNLAYNVLKLFMEMDQNLFDQVQHEYIMENERQLKLKAEKVLAWEAALTIKHNDGPILDQAQQQQQQGGGIKQ